MAGGEAAWRARPFVSLSCCFVVPPLRFAEDACRGLEVAVAGGMPVLLLSAGQAGATSPAALRARSSRPAAEVLAGLCYVNALKPGAPAIFGTWPFVSDLRTGAMSGGSAEQALLMAACAQMGQFYDLPTGVASGMSDSKLPDAQSGAEKGTTTPGRQRRRQPDLRGGWHAGEPPGLQPREPGDRQRHHRCCPAHHPRHRGQRGVAVVRDHAPGLHRGAGALSGQPADAGPDAARLLLSPGRRPLEPEEWAELGRTDIVQRATVKVETLLGGHFPGHLAAVDRQIRDRFPIRLPEAPMRPAPRARGMTRTARVVVIGGGAVGCSALYHLALRGWTDCLLLEMNELTSGSTWHAAGNCPTFSGSWTMMKMQAYGARLYRRLSAELEGGIGYHGTGSIRLAHHRERMDEFRHVQAMAQAQGLAYDLLARPGPRALPVPGAARPRRRALGPARRRRRPVAADPGLCPPRPRGRLPHRPVHPRHQPRGRSGEWLVGTDKGETIRAEIVVNAAGYRAGEIMALVGQHLPIVAMQHQYLVTEDIPAWSSAARTSCRCCATPTSPTICARSARASSSAPTSGSAAPSGRAASRPTSPTSSGPTIWAGSSATSRTPAPACRSWPRAASSAWSTARSPTRPTATPISARTG